MEFWGVEVKPGETLKVEPESYGIIHISQVSLGEFKNAKGNTNVPLRLKIDGKSFVLGFLSTEDRPQMMVDLVFEKEFELSHDWKNGSVYFTGYTADEGNDEFGDDENSLDEEGELANGLPVKGEPEINDRDNSDSDNESESADMDVSEPDSSSDDEPLSKDNEQEASSSDDEPPKKQPLKNVGVVAKKPNSAPQKTGGKKGQAAKAPSPKNASKGKNAKRSSQKKA